jgi:F0F1-type ATP synthase assembly protein I
LLASAVVAIGGGWWAGWQGVLSSFLGGIVNVSAGIVFAVLVRLGRPETAAATIRTMLRAEMAKIAVIVLLLWLVLTTYRDVVYGAFFAAFVVTVLVSQAAILIRD